jgi:hypothetical protein
MCPTLGSATKGDFKRLRTSLIFAAVQQHPTPCQPFPRFNQSLVQVLL